MAGGAKRKKGGGNVLANLVGKRIVTASAFGAVTKDAAQHACKFAVEVPVGTHGEVLCEHPSSSLIDWWVVRVSVAGTDYDMPLTRYQIEIQEAPPATPEVP